MIECIIAGYIILPTAFNLIVIKHKRNKTNKICRQKLEEKGYIVDDRFKSILSDKIMRFACKKGDINFSDTDFSLEPSIFSLSPFIRWYDLYSNFKYLFGDYSGLNEVYAALEDSIEDEEIIEHLKECELIKEDKEQMQFLRDKDNTLKELGKKYEETDINISLKENICSDINFSDQDSLDELKQKMTVLQELIDKKARKQDEGVSRLRYDNDNIEYDSDDIIDSELIPLEDEDKKANRLILEQ